MPSKDKSRRRKRAGTRSFKRYLPILGVVVLFIAVALFGWWMDERDAKPEPTGDYHLRDGFVEVFQTGGREYRLRKDLTTFLLMGIDRESDEDEGLLNRDGGQADFLRLLVLDDANERITQIEIDRDTMTPITILGVMGNKTGVRTAQISLSHGFGDGGAESAELTVEAVSNLFYGIEIDGYAAMNMSGINVLNDAVDGIEVTIEDDFSEFDPEMVPGATLTLKGKQAELFVRSRMAIGVGTNEARMARQQTYIGALGNKVADRIRADKSWVGELFDDLSPYLVTNIGRGRIINEAWQCRDYERPDVVKVAGEHRIGSDGFMQYEVDQGKLEQLVLDCFYEEVIEQG